MKYLILILKGVLFGVANMIPGVSGGTMAVLTGVYEEFLDSINHLFSSFKKSMKFLIPYGIGIILSFLLISKLIDLCLEHLPVQTLSLFAGLIAGGVPTLFKPIKTDVKLKYIGVFITAIFLIILFLFIPVRDISIVSLEGYDYILLFISGVLASIAMVVPGISGMLIFMLFGYYDVIISTLTNLTHLSMFVDNMKIMIPVGIGVIIGLFSACKLFSILLKKFPIASKFAILGFVISSIVCVIYKTSHYYANGFDILYIILMLVVGIAISFGLSCIELKKPQEELPKEENIE